MKTLTEKILNKYLNFGGDKSYKDFDVFFKEIIEAKLTVAKTTHDYKLLEYVYHKIEYGLHLCALHGAIYVMVDESSIEDIEEAIEGNELSGKQTHKPKAKRKTAPTKKVAPKKKATSKKKKDSELGKIVDHGQVAPEGNSDVYWGREGIDLVFQPNDSHVRVGEKIASTYKYADVRFLENYYGLKAFEFGNWLSQQDRVNYLSGLGLALFDLHKLLGFTPKQIGMNGKLSVAFGARGRGKAVAHFEPAAFVINLTRYSRPKKLDKRPANFRRVSLILEDGGVGSFAHEFGHALDFYAGTFIEKAHDWQISGGRDTNPAIRFPSLKKPKLQALMDNLLNKIIWKGKNVQSDYYKRLNKKGTKEYYLRRNEIWARSFEVYVHFKLEKRKNKNVFLNKSKYAERFYLTFTEMKKIEKDYDALITEIAKHL
jgi:hypothetical protein